MNLKYSGLLFVVVVLFEAINADGVLSNGTKDAAEGRPVVVHPTTDKPLPEPETDLTKVSEVVVDPKGNLTVLPVTIPTTNSTTTTTTSSTTTPPTTTTSTTPPTTTTTTTPAPSTTPAPDPQKGTWIIHDNTTKMTCIIADMVMQLNVTYPGKSKVLHTQLMNVPKDSVANGTCKENDQVLQINWGSGHHLVINFKANRTAKNFFVSGLSLTVNATVLKDYSGNDTMLSFTNKSSEFTTPLEMSYKCSKPQNVNLESEDPQRKAVLSLRDTQMEAFMNKTKAEFGAAEDCDTLDTPDIIPIAVGCALAILVLVVLVAYLIGRKRSQNRGYLSM